MDSINSKIPTRKKKRVGIISLFHENINYGGILQAYALQTVIENMGYDCEQIRYEKPEIQIYQVDPFKNHTENKKDKNNRVFHFLFLAGTKLSNNINQHFITPKRLIRRDNFKKFTGKYVKSSQVYTNTTLLETIENYDLFICGSDQIWNPNWYASGYFLSFVPESIPKIAYAASIGIDSLTTEQRDFMKPLISRLDAVSVREDSAVSLIQNMTEKKIFHALDPTLLLDSEEWNKVCASNPEPEKYLFAYILSNDKKILQCVEQFAKKKNLKLVTFPFTASEQWQIATNNIKSEELFAKKKNLKLATFPVTDSEIWQITNRNHHNYGGPDEWISLIRNAEYVITDSYHGTVFSLIYHKRFVVLKRNADEDSLSMNTRLYSLFKKFSLEKQIVDATISSIEDVIEGIDWTLTDTLVNQERRESINWLSDMINGKVE